MDQDELLRDDRLEESKRAESLGAPSEQFGPSMTNLVAGLILGLLLIGAGLTILVWLIRTFARIIAANGEIPFFAERGESWSLGSFFGLIGLGLASGGVALIWWMRRLSLQVVSVRPGGISCESPFRVVTFPWVEIVRVHDCIRIEHLPILKGVLRYAMPTRTNHTYTIHRGDGVSYAFDGNSVAGIDRLGALLREESDRRGVPWSVEEVRD